MYRGRIAPSPTGFLHLGHAKTFSIAAQRAIENNGKLILRIEDLDFLRCKDLYTQAAIKDLHTIGISWDEGPDIKSPYAPYLQSKNILYFYEIWEKLRKKGLIYPCRHSRKELNNTAIMSPHGEPIYPTEWRSLINLNKKYSLPIETNWRFCVPDGKTISFIDKKFGKQSFTCGKDFGDFLIWRKEGFPSYELAVVADDIRMKITEVVRGADLLLSTARQILLYQALDETPPEWCHVPLVCDEKGERLAKQNHSLSLRTLLTSGEKLHFSQFSL